MNKLEQWTEDDVIAMDISEVAQLEALAGDDLKRQSKACKYIAIETLANSSYEKALVHKIKTVLFAARACTRAEHSDVEIIFNSIKYEAILITQDGNSKRQPGGILGNRDKLKKLGANILTDEEAVRLVEDMIRKRDDMARKLCEQMGEPLPEWVDKD